MKASLIKIGWAELMTLSSGFMLMQQFLSGWSEKSVLGDAVVRAIFSPQAIEVVTCIGSLDS
jgi:hypothetical protein